MSSEVCIDFNQMSAAEIAAALKKHHLSLMVDEILHFQQNILKRPPTLVECQIWSICQQESLSYKNVRLQLPTIEKKTGIIFIAKDRYGVRYGFALRHHAFAVLSLDNLYEEVTENVAQTFRSLCATGAEVFALGCQMSLGDRTFPQTQRYFENIVRGFADFQQATSACSLGESLRLEKQMTQHPLTSLMAFGVLSENDLVSGVAPENAHNYVLVLVGSSMGNNPLFSEHLAKAHYALFEILRKKKLLRKIGLQAVSVGGIAVASAKLAAEYHYGVVLNIENIPAKNKLSTVDILCDATAERYLLALPHELLDYVTQHYLETFALAHISPEAHVTMIGELIQDAQWRVYEKKHCIIDLPIVSMITSIPYEHAIKSRKSPCVEPDIDIIEDLNDVLLKLLSHENIADHSMLKQYFTRPTSQEICRPFDYKKYPAELRSMGVVFSLAQQSRYFEIDAYWGAINVMVKALCDVAAHGAYPQVVTQCFYGGNPKNSAHMAIFSEMACGIADACKEFHLNAHPDISIPVLSQDVSLHHPSSSVFIGCLGVINDAAKKISSAFKRAGSYILLVGARKDECGGSMYYQLHQQLGARLPKPDIREVERQISALTECVQQSLVLSARAISEGGVAVCLAKMAIPNQLGLLVDIHSDLPKERLLFSETSGFVLEVHPENIMAVEDIFEHYQSEVMLIGEVTSAKRLLMQGAINLSVEFAEEAWKEGFREQML